jgi:hypothetical protein
MALKHLAVCQAVSFKLQDSRFSLNGSKQGKYEELPNVGNYRSLENNYLEENVCHFV